MKKGSKQNNQRGRGKEKAAGKGKKGGKSELKDRAFS